MILFFPQFTQDELMLLIFNIFLVFLFTYLWIRSRENLRKGKKEMKIGIRYGGSPVSTQLMKNLSVFVIIWALLFLAMQLIFH